MPGVRGPAQTPTTPVEAKAPLIASDSNHSSSRSPTDIVITRNSSSTSRARARRRGRPRAAATSRSPGRFEPSAGGGRSISGRRKPGHAREQRLELRVGAASRLRVRRDRLARPLGVVEEEDRPAVRRDRGEGGVERDRLVAEVAQPQVLDDLRLQHRDDVGGARDALARPHLLGHAGAAEDVAALEHAHAQAGARQVGRGGQPVVPAADDDRVEALRRSSRSSRDRHPLAGLLEHGAEDPTISRTPPGRPRAAARSARPGRRDRRRGRSGRARTARARGSRAAARRTPRR